MICGDSCCNVKMNYHQSIRWGTPKLATIMRNNTSLAINLNTALQNCCKPETESAQLINWKYPDQDGTMMVCDITPFALFFPANKDLRSNHNFCNLFTLYRKS